MGALPELTRRAHSASHCIAGGVHTCGGADVCGAGLATRPGAAAERGWHAGAAAPGRGDRGRRVAGGERKAAALDGGRRAAASCMLTFGVTGLGLLSLPMSPRLPGYRADRCVSMCVQVASVPRRPSGLPASWWRSTTPASPLTSRSTSACATRSPSSPLSVSATRLPDTSPCVALSPPPL
jgi:hypothetical protein